MSGFINPKTPALASVATSGNYADLAGKPAIGRTVIANSIAATANNTGNGTLTDAPMFSVAIPASAIIPQSGMLVLTANINLTSNSNAKALQCFFGGVKVVASFALPANVASALVEVFITNTGTKNAQITYMRVTTTAGTICSPAVASTVDTSAAQNLGLYSELTTSGDTMQTVTWKVEASN